MNFQGRLSHPNLVRLWGGYRPTPYKQIHAFGKPPFWDTHTYYSTIRKLKLLLVLNLVYAGG